MVRRAPASRGAPPPTAFLCGLDSAPRRVSALEGQVGGSGGIKVLNQSTCLIEDCDVYGNIGAQVEVGKKSEAEVRRSKIHDARAGHPDDSMINWGEALLVGWSPPSPRRLPRLARHPG